MGTPPSPQCRRNLLWNVRGILFFKIRCQFRLLQTQVDKQSANLTIFGKAYHIESILQVKFFRGTLLQLFQTFHTVWIPNHKGAENLATRTWRTPEKRFLEDKRKCRKQSIEFLGHIVLSEGIKIDSSKAEAITKMPLPRSVQLMNYL